MALGPLGRVYTHIREWWRRESDDGRPSRSGPPIDPAYNGLYLTDASSPDAADAAEDVQSNDGRSDRIRQAGTDR